VTQLGGTGRLGDDLYLLAHHETTGRPHLQPRALGLGLGGALLAELMLAGAAGVWRDRVVTARRARADDDVTRSVLRQVAAEPGQHTVRDWLLFLARTAAGDVAQRLADAGYLTRVSAGLFRRGGRWAPVDADCAFAPVTRVMSALSPASAVPGQWAVLAGLAGACGLGHRLALYLPAGLHQRLDEAVGQLDPGLRDLIAATRAAVDSAVLSHRV
jgi:Golgi phosphoprotein 3 GPP34